MAQGRFCNKHHFDWPSRCGDFKFLRNLAICGDFREFFAEEKSSGNSNNDGGKIIALILRCGDYRFAGFARTGNF